MFPSKFQRKLTVPEQAQQRRKILNAWQEAEAKQEILRARKASETRQMLQKMNFQNEQNLQAGQRKEAAQMAKGKGKGPSLAPPEWSPLTPNAFNPVPGAKRKATSEDVEEVGRAEPPNMPTRLAKAARKKGRSNEDSAGPGVGDYDEFWGW